MRAEQTVSEMVVDALARQAEVLSETTGRSFGEAFAKVLETPAGRLLGELADGPHRHEKAADWQADLLRHREALRPAYLRTTSEDGPDAGEGRHSWLGGHTEWVDGADGRAEYQARERFARLEG